MILFNEILITEVLSFVIAMISTSKEVIWLKTYLGKGLSSYEELRDVQLVELEILIKFAEICEKNNLRYFLDGGTLLGAIRHKGFIPWDDDIDLGMPREDYEKFMEVGQRELGNDYFVQHRATDRNCPFDFMKIRKQNTVFLEWNKRNIEMHHGIFIDVFPYDKLPQINKDDYKKECLNLHNKLIRRTIPDRTMQPQKNIKWILGAILRRLVYYTHHLFSLEKIDRDIAEAYTRYNDVKVENPIYACHSYGILNEFSEEKMLPTTWVEFENRRFRAPADPIFFLEQYYGDLYAIASGKRTIWP